MLISAYDVMGFGLKQLSLVLLCTGAGIIVFTTIGFCAGSGRRSIAMQFYSICLLLGAIYQVGFGVLSLIRRSKVKYSLYLNISYSHIFVDGGLY